MATDPKSVKKRHEASLKSLPNVESLGVGPKLRNGEPTGEMAIKVFVRRKVPLSDLAPDERIPESIEGIPTDVQVIAPLRAR